MEWLENKIKEIFHNTVLERWKNDEGQPLNIRIQKTGKRGNKVKRIIK